MFSQEVMEMLIKKFEQIHKEKKESLILISHQERIIRMADRIMVISDGKIQKAADGHAFKTRRLLESESDASLGTFIDGEVCNVFSV